MERFKEFEVAHAESNAEPIGFGIEGRKFICIPPPIPAGVVGDVGQDRINTPQIIEFIRGVLTPESDAEFVALIHDKDVRVPATLLTDVFNWLVEEYTGRPTKPLDSSADGQSSGGDTSKDA